MNKFRQFYDEGKLNEQIAETLGYYQEVHPESGMTIWYSPKDKQKWYLPLWDKDKNPWVEGSEVVEYLENNNLIPEFEHSIGNRHFKPYLFVSAQDYAQAFIELVLDNVS